VVSTAPIGEPPLLLKLARDKMNTFAPATTVNCVVVTV